MDTKHNFQFSTFNFQLFFKEWIKSRWALLIILVVFAGVMVYSFISISTALRLMGAGQVWEGIVQKGFTYFDYVKFLPLLAGVLLAVVQYAPEVINKRFKLTLHLPLPEYKIMLTMLLFGVLGLAVIFLATYFAIAIGLSGYFPTEIVQWNLDAVRPWLWGGIAAYLLSAWACLEPVWRQRVFDALIACGLLALFYFGAIPGAYAPFLPILVVLIALSVSFSFYSLIRFKDGEQ
jgi:hypothetical protein